MGKICVCTIPISRVWREFGVCFITIQYAEPNWNEQFGFHLFPHCYALSVNTVCSRSLSRFPSIFLAIAVSLTRGVRVRVQMRTNIIAFFSLYPIPLVLTIVCYCSVSLFLSCPLALSLSPYQQKEKINIRRFFVCRKRTFHIKYLVSLR